MKKIINLALGVLLLAPAATWADSIVITTVPASGALAPVTAGTTVGWGYSIQLSLDPGHYFMANGLSNSGFPEDSGAVTSPDVFDYPIYGTSGDYEVEWVEGTSGLYEFTWDPSATGQSITGTFTIDVTFWNGDPFDPESTMTKEFNYDVPFTTSTLAADAPGEAPEPRTWALFAGGLVIVLFRKRATA